MLHIQEVNDYDIKMWQEKKKKKNVMRVSTLKCFESQRKRHRERLTDKGWHVPVSINSPERLIVRYKALYTSYSNKQRSTGTTRHYLCVSDKVLLLPFLRSQQTRDSPPETLPKHLMSICTSSHSLLSTPLPSLFSLHFFPSSSVLLSSVSSALLPPRLSLLKSASA